MNATSRRIFVAGVLAAGMSLIAACGGSSASTGLKPGNTAGDGFPVTLQTASGPLVLNAPPTAIVSLSPTATEMLYAIGAGDQVKAVDKYSDYPADTPKTNLSALQVNAESLVALKPDLVIIPNPDDKLTARLKAVSVPLLVLPAATKLDDVYSEMSELGTATGHRQQAKAEETKIRGQLQQVVAAAPQETKPLTYYYELSPDFYSVTSGTFVGQLLKLAGLRSIADAAKGAAKSGGYPQLSAEFIVKANPDFIFLADTICCQQSAAKVDKRPGWARMQAVRQHHVVELNDDIASRWGPRIVVLLRTVVDALNGNAG